MSFAVLRAIKLGASGVGAATHHHEHRLDLPNADPVLSWLNRALIGTGNVWEDVHQRLNEAGITPRKNACLAVEFVVTASPEFYQVNKAASQTHPGRQTLAGHWQPIHAYHQTALAWFQQRYGKENVVTANLHLDEKTPHLHVFVVPILQKEISQTRQRKGQPLKARRTQLKTVLSATDVMGGPKELAELQTDFASGVAHLGLKRGIAGTGARHTTTRQYAALTAAAVQGENVALVEQTLQLLGNRRARLEQSELQQLKQALADSGLQLYKGRIMSVAEAQRAQGAERMARAKRRAEKPATGPKATPSPEVKFRR